MNFLKTVVSGAAKTVADTLGLDTSNKAFFPQLRWIAQVEPSVAFDKCFLIKKQEIMIGRDGGTADYVLDSAQGNMISRTHAVITRQLAPVSKEDINNQGTVSLDTFVISDKSMNGIFVNDVRIAKMEKTVIKHGDVLTFGGGFKTPFGGEFKQPDSELVFRFETVREAGINDMYQKSKPKKQLVGNCDATQVGEKEMGLTQILGEGDQPATQLEDSNGSSDGPTQNQKEPFDGLTQEMDGGVQKEVVQERPTHEMTGGKEGGDRVVQQVLDELNKQRQIADVGYIEAPNRKDRKKERRQRSADIQLPEPEVVKPVPKPITEETDKKSGRVRKRKLENRKMKF